MKHTILIFLILFAVGCDNDEPYTYAYIGDSHVYFAKKWEPNYGICGAHIKDVPLADELAYPDEVYILVGCNDLGHGRTIRQAISDYKDVLISYRYCNTYAIGIWAPSRDYKNVSYRERLTVAKAREFNRRLKKICKRYDVEFIDTSALTNGNGLMPQYTDDGLHLNTAGYDKLYNIIGG